MPAVRYAMTEIVDGGSIARLPASSHGLKKRIYSVSVETILFQYAPFAEITAKGVFTIRIISLIKDRVFI